MKKLILVFFSLAMSVTLFAQDEGAVVTRERLQRNKGIFIGGGVSSVLANNFGDYSKGTNFEAGYLKRLNRVISIGGSFSYLKFNYDPNVQNKAPQTNDFPSNFYYDSQNDDGYVLGLSGGNLSILSLAFNIKINFIPVKDNSVISVYGFAKPFIATSKRTDVSGSGSYYYYDTEFSQWSADASSNETWDKSGYPVLAAQTKTTGGIFLGPGVELFPGRTFSFYAQASFGYTFPINIVSTRSYGHDISDYQNPDFPMKNLGFTSINFSGGVSYNFH